jgi:hypothetical protein
MPAILKNLIATGNLAPGVPTTIAHGLEDAEGRAILPDHLESSSGDIVVVAADATNITVRNDGSLVAAATILVERWHSVSRAFPGGVQPAGLPFVGGSGGSGGVATNVKPVSMGGARLTIYANQAGSDATGDGSAGNPYRTFVRAMQDVPLVINDGSVIVDITDLGVETLPPPSVFQGKNVSILTINNSRDYDIPPVDVGQAVHYGLTIRARTTLVADPGAYTQSADSVTGKRSVTFTVSPGWGVDEHKGKLLSAPGNYALYRIFSNTADTVVVGGSSAISGDLTIVEESAELVCGDGGGEGISFSGAGTVQFDGVRFSGSGSIGYPARNSTMPAATAYFYNCTFDGVSLEHLGTSVSYSSWMKNAGIYAGNSQFFYTLSENMAWNSRGKGNSFLSEFYISGCTFNNCGVIGQVTGSGYETPSAIIWTDRCDFDDTQITLRTGRHHIRRTRLQNCAGDAILITTGASCRLDTVAGSVGNTGFGVRVSHGAQFNRVGTCSLTGTSGDIQVGDNAAPTAWAAVSPGSVTDLAAGNPQLCRAFG